MDRITGMTGPEHYLAGEEALQRSETVAITTELEVRKATLLAQQAQAHFAAASTLTYGAMVADDNDNAELDVVSAGWAVLLGMKVEGE